MANLASLQAVVHGRVQGVFYRDFVRKQASALGLTGYVRNLPDGNSVEVVAEGETENLKKLQEYLKFGPSRSHVEKVDTSEGEYSGSYFDFKIRH
ncbi:MAG: acylphosphatase [Dehalococcoidales bacterium]|nr:acylphosphatase [Dehalococcoidales bacterium]